MYCWGKFIPQINAVKPWFGPWASVTAGEDWVCAVAMRDGVAECRGFSTMGQAAIPAEFRNASWATLSAGFQHTCGVVAKDKRLVCWGSNLAGESSVPSARDAGLAFPGDAASNAWGSVAAGTHWTCGVRGAPRQLTCWGVIRDYPPEATTQYEEFGQVSKARAMVVDGGGVCSWEVVTAGKHHACGITAASAGSGSASGESGAVQPGGEIRCWGSNVYGQSAPPKVGGSEGFTPPWRAWPASPDLGGSGRETVLSTVADAGQCPATTSGAGSVVATVGGGGGRRGALHRALLVAAATFLFVAIVMDDTKGGGEVRV